MILPVRSAKGFGCFRMTGRCKSVKRLPYTIQLLVDERIEMSDFDAQVRESQEQVAAAQAKITELTSRVEVMGARVKSGDDISVDIENASLEDVHAHTQLMNANIAELIMGLDDVTAGFSKDFDEMRSKTGWESFVGIFSQGKADSLRQERMRTANVDDKLQDLIGNLTRFQSC